MINSDDIRVGMMFLIDDDYGDDDEENVLLTTKIEYMGNIPCYVMTFLQNGEFFTRLITCNCEIPWLNKV